MLDYSGHSTKLSAYCSIICMPLGLFGPRSCNGISAPQIAIVVRTRPSRTWTGVPDLRSRRFGIWVQVPDLQTIFLCSCSCSCDTVGVREECMVPSASLKYFLR